MRITKLLSSVVLKYLSSFVVVWLMAGSAYAQIGVFDQVRIGTSLCRIRSGIGSPEALVTGNVCDIYINTTSGTIYTKTSGSSTTGWTLASSGSFPVTAANGGTGQTSYTIGDILYASGTTTLSKLADVGTGSFLRSGGVAGAPAWSATTLPNSATTGDLIYASASDAYSNLAAVATGSYLRAAGTSTAPVWSTTTLPNSATTGDVLYASASNVYSNLASVAAGSFIRSAGTSTAPVWSTTTVPNSATTGDIMYASASNVYANLAAVATGSVLASAGTGTAPAYTANPTTTTVTASVASVGTSTTDGLIAQNSNATPASSGSQQMSPRIRMRGYGFGTTAGTSQTVDSWFEVLPIQSTVPTAQLQAMQQVAGGTAASLWTATPSNFTVVAAIRSGTGYRITSAQPWVSNTAPTISSGFGTSPTITTNGTGALRINVGTGGTASTGVVGLPTATTGWNCYVENITTFSATVFRTVQTASTTTTVTIGNYDNTNTAAAWAASDVLSLACFSY